MTLDEAIKILKSERDDHHSFRADIIGQAEQLGLEALSYINICRHNPNCYHISLLPGETEE